jgi:hypothetical protein
LQEETIMAFKTEDIEIARNAFAPLRYHFAVLRGTRTLKELQRKLPGEDMSEFLLDAVDITEPLLAPDLIDNIDFQATANIPAKDIFSAAHKSFFATKPYAVFAGYSELMENPPPKDIELLLRYNEIKTEIQVSDAIVNIAEKAMRTESYPISTLADMIRLAYR